LKDDLAAANKQIDEFIGSQKKKVQQLDSSIQKLQDE